MAILSISRRTDIPTYFSEWFINRLESGEVYTRNNPYNPNALSHITWRKEDIDCIVFWTKNPLPMLSKIDRLKDYKYYFQFTLTGYGKEIEGNLPDKTSLMRGFRELSKHCRVVWRYDPIIFTKAYTIEWHIKAFDTIAKSLAGYTDRCVVSFIDIYNFVKTNLNQSNIFPKTLNADTLSPYSTAIADANNVYVDFCKKIVDIANKNGMKVYSCAEVTDFQSKGIDIQHGSCIDKDMIESIVGYSLRTKKDPAQRSACQCVESVDFGKYNTCANGCKYCYACKVPSEIKQNLSLYDVNSPILCDTIQSTDTIGGERRLKSLKVVEDLNQISFF